MYALVIGLAAFLAANPMAAQRAMPESSPTTAPKVGTVIIPALDGALVATLVVRPSTKDLAPYVDRARLDVFTLDSMVASTDSAADVVRINYAAGRTSAQVSPMILSLLAAADRAWILSDQRLDPTSPPLVDALKIREQLGLVQSAAQFDSLRALVDLGAVKVDTAARTVMLPRLGMRLDLSLIARGRGFDLARAAFPVSAFAGGVIQVGPSAVAFGRPAHGNRWQIVLAPPHTGRTGIGVATIDSGAVYVVADSAHGQFDDRHPVRLVNAQTGDAPSGVGSVTVISPTAERANADAAALYMLTPERALSVADSAGIAAMIIRRPPDGKPIGPADVLLSARARRLIELVPALTSSAAGRAR